MLRVTFVCLEWPHTSHVGGVARYAFRIASELKSLVDLTVVTLEGGQTIEGVRMVYLPRAESRFGRYYRTPFALRSVVDRIPSDVIHAFGDDWALKAGPPVVRTFLGSSLGEARASSGLRKLNHYVLALTEAISARKSAFRIAIGPDSRDEFKCDTVMPPVVQVARHAAIMRSPVPSVTFIGSFEGRKRGALVEKAVAEASTALGREVSLTVVGPAADVGSWGTKTKHLSGANDETVAAAVANSWVLMAPSLYEGFGIPVFEAMSLDVAVIASSNPGTQYIKSFGPDLASLAIVEDDKLAAALTARLHSGAQLTESELTGTRNAVQALLEAADPKRLVAEVYRTVSRVTHK